MYLSIESPTDMNSPQLTVIFAQNKPHNWVDIILYKFSSSIRNIQQILYHNNMISLESKKSKMLYRVGSDENEMIIIKVVSGAINGREANIKVNINTTFNSKISQSKNVVSFWPLKLLWSSVINLTNINSMYFVKLPGHPESVEFTNLNSYEYWVEVQWVFNRYNRKYLAQDKSQHYEETCVVNKLCYTPVLYRGKHLFKVIKTVNDFCTVLPELEENLIVYDGRMLTNEHYDYSAIFKRFKTHKRYNNYLMYKYPVCCLTTVGCLNYTLPNNHKRTAKRFYVLFDFGFFHYQMKCGWKPFRTKKSWFEASEICRIAGGTLPIIRSRDELEELTNLLKFGKALPPIEFLFIGISFDWEVSLQMSHRSI